MNTRKIGIIAKTELVLSLRSLDLILFGFLMPLAIIIVIGLIYGDHGTGQGMIERNIGSWISIGICAMGLMGLPLTLADYREKKVLKRLQVTPASPVLLLGVQLLVKGVVALLSGLLVLLAAVLFFDYSIAGSPVATALAYLVVLLAIFSIGLCVASIASDSKKAGLLCSILYFPMLLFSGTTIPFEVFPKGVQSFASVLPLTQGIKLINTVSLGGSFRDSMAPVVMLTGIFVVCTAVALKTFRWDMDA